MEDLLNTEIKEALLVACLPFQASGGPSFALPLFTHPDNPNVVLVQEIDEYSGVVSGFRALEDPLTNIVTVKPGTISKFGEHQVFAFVTEDGATHAGQLNELQSTLKAFSSRHPQYTAVNLQIMELVGNIDEQQRFRAKMRLVIAEKLSTKAARTFYEGSVLRSILWDRLVNSATSADAARRILDKRSSVSLTVDLDGAVKLDLSAIEATDFSKTTVGVLTTELQQEFESFISNTAMIEDRTQLDVSHILPSDQSGKVSGALRKIRSAGRQEERIAILLDQILHNRGIGISALLQYDGEKAKFANTALSHIRKRILPNNQKEMKDEIIVAGLVSRFYSDTFSPNKGALLYYLAMHLAKYPNVNKAIRQSLNHSASIWVTSYRDDINRLLDGNR